MKTASRLTAAVACAAAMLILFLSAAAGVGAEPPDASAALERGEVLVQSRMLPDECTAEATAVAIIKAEPDRVWRVITDYGDYADFMPHVKTARVIRREGVHVDLSTRVKVLLLTFDYTIRLQHDQAAGSIRWHLLEGDFRINRGYWIVREYEKNSSWTKVTYFAAVSPRLPVPKSILRILTAKSIPDIIAAVRQRAALPRYDPPPPESPPAPF